MSLKSVLYVGLAASALALWVPACGGDDDDDSAEGGTGGSEETGGAGGAENGGAGAETSTGGASATEEVLFDFATGDEGVEILDYDGTESGGIQYVNVGSSYDRETWMDLDPATTAPTAEQVDETGFDDEPGVIELTAQFNGYNQAVDLQWLFDSPQDLSGKILLARVMVVDDGGFVQGSGAAGGGTIFAKSGEDWVYARGGWYNLVQDDYGSWVEFEFDLDSPDYEDPGFDPVAVQGIGVQISTGGAEGDTAPTTATVYVDQITLYTP